jgi:hypothetical protein
MTSCLCIPTRRLAAILLSLSATTAVLAAADFSLLREPEALVVRAPDGKEALRYQLTPPAGTGLSVESGCYFHPLVSRSGVTLTEVAPSDHKHHRGIFCAWVEMHGATDADFWGWGEHAPKEGRRIVNRGLEDLHATATSAGFRAANEWISNGKPLVRETLIAELRDLGDLRALDLSYTFAVEQDLTLARWAFSGFCVRVPKAGALESSGPDGVIHFRDPVHVKPETDWPASPWYDYTLRGEDGRIAGLAVLDHPLNPPSQWHNHRGIRMLNPCIVAPSAVTIKAAQPLTLRYRVLAHDGPLDPKQVQQSWEAWSKPRP